MVDMNEVQNEIDKLENCGSTTYSVCEKLSILYNVKDHAEQKPKEESYARGMSFAGSDFMAAAMQIPQDELVRILDEHMEAVKLVFPKEYRAVINKIKSAK